MKRTPHIILATGAIAVFSAASASAADFVSPIVPAPAGVVAYDDIPYQPVDVWSGFYLGAHAGVLFHDDDSDEDGPFLGGIQGGYTHQFGQFVLGGELAASFSDDFVYTLEPGATLSQNWSVTASARAGVALDHTLIYGTLGYTLAELEPNGDVTLDDDINGGVSFGAGVEHQFGQGIAARLEYTQTHFLEVGSTVGGVARTDDLVNHAVRVGFNVHF